mmetsp:Transcript_66419/g.210213  ORF Transcript_66419/g.210213 Transcript_66419/m.210213 type:complete len:203 (-) Transcript_66419:209-817(-)
MSLRCVFCIALQFVVGALPQQRELKRYYYFHLYERRSSCNTYTEGSYLGDCPILSSHFQKHTAIITSAPAKGLPLLLSDREGTKPSIFMPQSLEQVNFPIWVYGDINMKNVLHSIRRKGDECDIQFKKLAQLELRGIDAFYPVDPVAGGPEKVRDKRGSQNLSIKVHALASAACETETDVSTVIWFDTDVAIVNSVDQRLLK